MHDETLAYSPAPHAVQEELALAATYPGLHGLHAVIPGRELAEPGGHGWQWVRLEESAM